MIMMTMMMMMMTKLKRKIEREQRLRVFNAGNVKKSDSWENISVDGQENIICVKK
jgi:hypothetical protein